MTTAAKAVRDARLLELPRIANLIVASDEVGEGAFRALVPAHRARVFTTRMAYIGNEQTGYRFRDSFAEVLATLPLPQQLDVIVFGCTAASIILGPQALEEELGKLYPQARVIALGNAVIDALRALALKKIAVLTPYPLKSHSAVVNFIENNGIDVVSSAYYGLHEDSEIGSVAASSLFESARALVQDQVIEGLFISCAGLPIIEHVQQLEEELNLPVIVSSQAAAWKVLQVLSLPYEKRLGKLMQV
jgi:maleate isomerase